MNLAIHVCYFLVYYSQVNDYVRLMNNLENWFQYCNSYCNVDYANKYSAYDLLMISCHKLGKLIGLSEWMKDGRKEGVFDLPRLVNASQINPADTIG